MVYLRITGRALVNVHSANAEGAVGNYMALSKMFIIRRIDKGYEILEEPVISGNMLKHWHAVSMVDILKSSGYSKLCEYCSRYVMYRSPDKNKDSEDKFIIGCAIEDVHGFLQPDAQVRRDSLMKFSFMLPIEELRTEYEAVTHNRVVTDKSGKISAEEQAMMVFKREHASGIYGFLISGDLAYVGRPLSNPSTESIPIDERKTRAKAAVLALINLLSGRFGAAASRAMPAIRLSEIILAISKQPIPNLVHGFYYDYAEESTKILESILNSGLAKDQDLKVYVSGEKPAKLIESNALSKVVEQVASPIEALTKSVEVIESWLS